MVEVIPGFVWGLIGALAAFALAAAAASSLIAARARGLSRQREALLRDVGLLQEALLPAAPEQIAGAAATVAYRPAAGAKAGRDFYDVFAIDERRLGIVVGRVSAGGRRALGVTAHIRHVLRAYLEGGLRPRNALQVGADVLENHLGPDYACVAVAVHDAETSELTWAAAGMPAPVVAGAVAFEPVTVGAAPPIGMGVATGGRQTTLVLPAHAVACLYTDGLTDAVVNGERYGYRRLCRAVEALDGDGAAETLLERVSSESARVGDDMAAVVLRAGPEAPAATPEGERRVEELELSARELRGERAELFLRDCGLPTSRIPPLVEELREEGRRLGGIVLRVHFGPGVPEADVALRSMDVLHAPSAGRDAPVPEVSLPGRSGG